MLFGSVARAQSKINPTVEIITDYQGKINEADRIGLSFTADSLTSAKPNFTYQTLSPTINNKFTMQPIPAARMNIPTALKDGGLGYFRGSLAYPMAPDLNLYLNIYSRSNTYFNLFFNHRSFWGNVPLYKEAPLTTAPIPSEIKADNANTRIGLALQHFWDKVAIDLNAVYDNRYLIYYGQDTLLLRETAGTDYINNISDNKYIREHLSQTFHILKAGISLYSVNRDNNRTSFKIDGNINYIKESAHLTGNDPTAQSLLGAKAWFNHKIYGEHAIDVDLGVKTYNRSGGAPSVSLLHLAPCYQYNDKGLSFMAGINLEGVNDNDDFAVNVYPKIAISYKVEDWFIPYASATGGTRLNNYEKIITENPYILPGLEVANSRYLVDLQAGIRGSINPYLSYQLNVGYSTIDNMYFFVNSTTPLLNDGIVPHYLRSNFQAMRNNINLLTLGGAVSCKLGSFEALFKMQYYHYMWSEDNPLVHNKAWHRPNFEFGMNLRYKVMKNLIFNVDGYFRGETPVMRISDLPTPLEVNATTTPAYFDLGLMVEYRITQQISAFAQVTNLLNNNYQQYYLYYTLGTTIGAGISVAF